MAVDTVTVTNVYQQIAVGVVTVTVARKGSGSLFFNETASDTAAFTSNPPKNEQYSQTENKATFVRSDGTGTAWILRLDGVLS